MIANCGRVRSANLHNIALSIADIDYDDTEKEEDSNDDVDAADFILVGFLTSSSTTWLYRGRTPRQSV